MQLPWGPTQPDSWFHLTLPGGQGRSPGYWRREMHDSSHIHGAPTHGHLMFTAPPDIPFHQAEPAPPQAAKQGLWDTHLGICTPGGWAVKCFTCPQGLIGKRTSQAFPDNEESVLCAPTERGSSLPWLDHLKDLAQRDLSSLANPSSTRYRFWVSVLPASPGPCWLLGLPRAPWLLCSSQNSVS